MALQSVIFFYTARTEIHPVSKTKCPTTCVTACIDFLALPIIDPACIACDKVIIQVKDSAKVVPLCEDTLNRNILGEIVSRVQLLDSNDCPTNNYQVVLEYDDAQLVDAIVLQTCDINTFSCFDPSDEYLNQRIDCVEVGPPSEFSFLIDGDSGPAQTVNDGETVLILGGVGCTSTASATNTVTIDVTATSFFVDGDSGPAQTISDGNTLLILGGEGCATIASATDTLTINVNPVSADVGNLITNGSDNQAFINCAAIAACAGEAFSFFAAGSSGTPQTISSGNTLTIAQGNGITTAASATDTVTITARLSGTAGNFLVIDSTALYVPTPAFTVAGSSGTPQTISNGNTLTIAAGTGCTTVASATDTVTINVTATSFTVAADSGTPQVISDGNTLTIVGGAGCASVASATDTVTLNVAPVSVDADNIIIAGSDGQAYLDCDTVAACISIDATQSITLTYTTTRNNVLIGQPVVTLGVPGVGVGQIGYPATAPAVFEKILPFNGAISSIAINTGMASVDATVSFDFDIMVNQVSQDTVSNTFNAGAGATGAYQASVTPISCAAGDLVSIKVTRIGGTNTINPYSMEVSLVYVEI